MLLIVESIVVDTSNKTIFISMSGRDSAMWFSYTGLYLALKENNIDADFSFPSSDVEDENEFLDNVFFYNLKRPLKTLKSIYNLSKLVNKRYNNVVIFSQGIFSAFVVLFFNKNIHVSSWGHEISNHIKRAGFFRGINYYLSDRLIKNRISTLIVSSNELKNQASILYPSKKVIEVCLPMSGDFSILKESSNVTNVTNDRHKIKILFFGCINAYKGLDVLDKAISQIEQSKIEVTILGRGDLEEIAPELYLRFKNKLNVNWFNKFISAEDVVEHLNNHDFMFTMYNSVTATSQVDIANCFGVPVIASDLPFFRDKIENGLNGFILKNESFIEFINNFVNGKIEINKQEIIDFHLQQGVNNKCVDALINNKVV